jgi:hypothetical protein
MAKPLTDDQLKVLIDTELRQSYGYGSGKLEQQRRKAEYFFLAEPKEELAPPAIEGRSRVVDTTVRNTVLGMEGPLLKTFYGSDNVFEFEESRPEDAPKAKLISEYVNHVFRRVNPGYTITATWIREALMQKVGIVKVWWDPSDIESREDYTGQTIEQVTMLMDDGELEIIDQKSYPDEDAEKQQKQVLQQMEQQLAQMAQAAQGNPQAAQQLQAAQAQYEHAKDQPAPMLYDISVKRTKSGGRARIENVPPEEFLISKRAKSIAESPLTAHRFKRTIAELKADGYTLPDPLPSDDAGAQFSMERVERLDYVDYDAYAQDSNDTNIDPAQRTVWVIESYLKCDYDGDGLLEWRKVTKCGTSILDNEECDGPPFVALGSIPLPHVFYGMCPADLAIEPQKIKTSLKRAALDNQYLQANGRYFAVENQVNLDDLLNSRPGGVVRIKNAGAVGRLDQATGDVAGTMQMLEAVELDTEEATGWTRQSQGGNGLQLSQTATQANIITNRADSRIETISRYMAETGWTELGLMIFKLVQRYQKKAEMVKVAGEWVNIDPREWHTGFSLNINVGLGTGNKDQLVSHLMALKQAQMVGLQTGHATPQNLYNADQKLANALGFKNGDEFFTDPSKMPPKPPQQDPALVKAQLDDQAHQREMALKAQQSQMDAQMEQYKAQVQAQAQMQIDQNRQQAMAQQHALEIQHKAELAQLEQQFKDQQHARDASLKQYEIDQDNATKVAVAEIQAGTGPAAEKAQGLQVEQLQAPIMEHLAALHDKIDRSARMQTHIVHNPDGTKYAVKVDPQEQGAL